MSANCPCTDYSCELNPRNHDKGCTPCIEDSLVTKELPRCFFASLGEDIETRDDWSYEAFAKLIR